MWCAQRREASIPDHQSALPRSRAPVTTIGRVRTQPRTRLRTTGGGVESGSTIAWTNVGSTRCTEYQRTSKEVPYSYTELQTVLREKKSDASESPWFYLVILIVLIAEQALAVHLSFHVKGGEGAGTPATATATPRQQARAAETAGV